MRKILEDPQVKTAIETLQTKGVTLDQISIIYKHFYANLPAPGSEILWKATGSIKKVRENRSRMFRVEDGYIQIQNNSRTDMFLLPHEYDVILLPQAIDSTELLSVAEAEPDLTREG